MCSYRTSSRRGRPGLGVRLRLTAQGGQSAGEEPHCWSAEPRAGGWRIGMQRDGPNTRERRVLPIVTGFWNLKAGHLYNVQNTKCLDSTEGRRN